MAPILILFFLFNGKFTVDTLYGNEGSDFLLGDYGLLQFNTSAPNLYGMISIETLNCAPDEGGDKNSLFGNNGDGKKQNNLPRMPHAMQFLTDDSFLFLPQTYSWVEGTLTTMLRATRETMWLLETVY